MNLFSTPLASFRLSNFNVDGSITTKVVIDNFTDSQLLELRKLHESKQVGVILCSPELLNDLTSLLTELEKSTND
jgi:hypothetical protein